MTRYALRSGVPLTMLKREIAKHRVRSVSKTTAGHPLYSMSDLDALADGMTDETRRVLCTMPMGDYMRLARLAERRKVSLQAYAGRLLANAAKIVYEKHYAD